MANGCLLENNELPPGFQIVSNSNSSTDSNLPKPENDGEDTSPVGLPAGFQLLQDKYSSPGQQALAGLEGAGQGFLGPISTLAETAFGVRPREILAREEANPITHSLGEAAGFVGGAFTGNSEAALVGKLGEAAVNAAKLGEAATTGAKIAAAGVKAGAEMAAFQASDESSKAILQDPSSSLGNAAINIGLSGIIGAAGGSVLGGVSQLWDLGLQKSNLGKIIDDAKAQYNFRQTNPDLVQGAANEVTQRMSEADEIKNSFKDIKSSAIQKIMPEQTPEQVEKINSTLNDLSEKVSQKLNEANASVKTRAAVPYLNEDLAKWQTAITDPSATPADQFLATNEFKNVLQKYPKYGLQEEVGARAIIAKDLAEIIQPVLEKTNIWGEAANVQKITNKAAFNAARATEDFKKLVTGKEMGELVADPAKLQTLLKQAEKGNAGLKTNKVANYLKYIQEQADAINEVHIQNGLDAPLNSQLNPTPILNHIAEVKPTAGVQLGNWMHDKGLAAAVGETAGTGVGAGIGAAVGHPAIGALIGERLLAPTIKTIAKPLLEKATDSRAAKASIDYVVNVIKGQRVLNDAISNFFKGSAVIPQYLLPSHDSRENLKKSLDIVNQDPQKMLKVGGSLGHYMPDHASQAIYTASQAQNYLNSLKPSKTVANPLDSVPPVDKFQEAKFNRALDIAEQPMMVLKHIKDGTLQPQDVQSLNTIYPGLHQKMIENLTESMAEMKSSGKTIPYEQKQALSLFMGKPLDTTMTPASAQAILASYKGFSQQLQQGEIKQHKQSAQSLKQINKVNSMYSTQLQSREENRKRG